MKISEIINELTELQQYIGDKELEACIANAAMTGVNVMYLNDEGGWTSTSLEGEKMIRLENEQKKYVVPPWIEKTLKEVGVTPNKESFGACLSSVKMENKKFNGWNNVSNTKIPLNEEIFALLEDRMNPKKLRPAVIIAKMRPAKRIRWTEQTEGDVLCYDVPAGNYHSCNGAQIKYWKYVNAPDFANFITGEYIE